jgi:molecular chaperone HtpG
MAVLENGNITIHTENIFPIIKKSLYSEHEIFLRELVSNAVDAIQKLKMVAYAGEYSGPVDQPEITISIDKDAKTLTVSDNGIGMTADEVKKYINQVAFSSAEEFVEKYKGGNDQPIIGHFGLGFYSAFIVAQEVEIDTRSYRDGAQAVHWRCDGSPSFELAESDRTTVGTSIILHLDNEELEYLEPARIRQLVKTYCDFMPVPIRFEEEVLNDQKAIWRQSASQLSKEDYLEFYRYLYPFQEEPLLWVHLNTDYPYQVNGILYFPKLRPDIDPNKGQIKLFCNQVFVTDHCEEVVPRFLLPMRGVIDSPDIPLNVSRSALQADRKVRSISGFIAKKVADRLKELFEGDRPEYVRIWQDLAPFVKFGAMNDEKFGKQVEELIIYRSTADLKETDAAMTDAEGRSYTTLKSYLERNAERQGQKVYYATDAAAQTAYIDLHTQQGLEVIFLDTFIDTHFVSFLEYNQQEVKFLRIDADLDERLLEKETEAEIVDPKTNKTRSDLIKQLFQQSLGNSQVTIRTEALKAENAATTPPAMVLLPEELRRMLEMNALMNQGDLKFPEAYTLLVNTNHPLIRNLATLEQGAIIGPDGASPSQELAEQICRYVFDLALMNQKGFDVEGLKSFTERSNQVLTKLTELATR